MKSFLKKSRSFGGFCRKSIAFLKELKKHNDKRWFEANRQHYEKHLVDPMQKLVFDLGPFMLSVDPLFEIRPAVNKTISRIYRDTRFSRDKSPYRTTMWMTFKQPGEGWQDRPAFFFELAPDSYRFGMGFYAASKDTMDALREVIDTRFGEFQKAVSVLKKQGDFVLEGERYKRILTENKSEDVLDWYQRKNLYLVCNRKIDERLFSEKLLDDLHSGFRLLAPLYHFLFRFG